MTTEKTFKFNLGVRVIDHMTGLKGIANAVVEWQSGSIQYSIQTPPKPDGSPGESSWMDPDHMEILADDQPAGIRVIPIDPHWAFNLGDTVSCDGTEYQGKITGRCLWINGCYKYYVRNLKLYEGQTVSQWFDESCLSRIAEQKKTEGWKPFKRTGGPSSPSGQHL